MVLRPRRSRTPDPRSGLGRSALLRDPRRRFGTMIAAAVGNDAALVKFSTASRPRLSPSTGWLNSAPRLRASSRTSSTTRLRSGPQSEESFPVPPIHFYSSAPRLKPSSAGRRSTGFVGGAQGASRLLQVHQPDLKEMSFEIDDKILAAIGK